MVIEGVQAAEQDTPKEQQNSEPTGTKSNALVALALATMAEYEVVKPITSRQKKAHSKALNLSQPQTINDPKSDQEKAPQPMQFPAQETQKVHVNMVD